jgi:sugar/nucleoside kinase (ribokinase family)
MIKIVCLGDNVVDINYIDHMINPGGNCVNVAVYCRQLGHDAEYIGMIADDSYGKIVSDALNYHDVRHDRCVVTHGETGRCKCELIDGDRVLSDENNGGICIASPFQITPEIVTYLKSVDIVHISCYSALETQLPILKEAEIPVLYDFSTIWTDEAVEKVAPLVDFILFSAKDNLDRDENLKIMYEAVDQYHCKMAILTMGIKGAWVYDGKTTVYKEPYHAEGGAIDTTGCGDSWISGFITTYIEQQKRLKQMMMTSDDAFITIANLQDVHRQMIQMSMSMGNLKARHTCRYKGAIGCGVKMDVNGKCY